MPSKINLLRMFLNKFKAIVLVMLSITSFSQEKKQKLDSLKNNKLDEVIVTATRTARQLSSVPMPVTLISKEQIQKSGSVRLRDILLEQTGITMVKDFGNSEGVQLQGISADYTLVLIDGVPIVGRTSGNIDLSRITVNNIKQIEIVKGPSSSLFGSEAIGGVINIITEKPKRDQLKTKYHILSRGGAKNELDLNADVVYRKKNMSVVSGLNFNSSEGFDLTPKSPAKTVNPHQSYTGNLQFTYDVSEKLNVLVSQRIYQINQYVNESVNKEIDWNFNGNIKHQISNTWKVDYSFYGTRFKTESQFNGETALFNRSLFRPEVKTELALWKGTMIAGVGGNFDALDRTSISGNKTYNAMYAFGQFDFYPFENFNVILGARFEDSDTYESNFSPKLSIGYEVTDWLTLKASGGFGFKAPDFRQLFFDFRNVNNGYVVLGTQTVHTLYPNVNGINTVKKELKPETSTGINVGFDVKPIGGLTVSVNAFRNDITDLIDVYDTQLNDPGRFGNTPEQFGLKAGDRLFSYRNINEVFTQGVEVDIKWRLTDNFKFFTGYQFLDTGNKEAIKKLEEESLFIKDASGTSIRLNSSAYFGLADRSKHMINAKLFYENYEHNFSANIRGVYRSKYAPLDTNSNGVIDTFDDFVVANTQINFSMDKSFFDNLLVIQFGIDNLFDNTAIENGEVFNFPDPNSNTGETIPIDTYLQLGRTYFGRIQFNF
ncbi:iron complex outermembrane recepter protein [Tenacibaculum sp. 190524A02b]